MMSSTTCSLSHSLNKSNHSIMSDIYNEMHLTDAGKVFFLLCRFKSVLKKQAAHGILPRRNAQNKENGLVSKHQASKENTEM